MKLGTKLSILAVSLFLVWMIKANSYGGTTATPTNAVAYHIGTSSGVVISSIAFVNAYAIIASTYYAVNIDDIKITCDDNATIDFGIALSTNVTGGVDCVIAKVRPIGIATLNRFTAKYNVTCSSSDIAVGTSFRVLANHDLHLDEIGGKLQIPKGYALILRAKNDADSATKCLYALFRVWE